MVMSQKPYLNLGAGRIILPLLERPAHHALVDEAIYHYPLWVNADRNAAPGIDCVTDLFTYPWPFEDNSFDGALLAHIAEHIPHEIKYSGYPPMRDRFDGGSELNTQFIYDWYQAISAERALSKMYQDGWYAFFAELYRVLTPGATAHILSPYGWSAGAITDPTHTRMLTEHTFTHSMQPEPESSFKYETGGIHFEMVEAPRFNITEMFRHLLGQEALLEHALRTQINVVYDFCVKLKAVK